MLYKSPDWRCHLKYMPTSQEFGIAEVLTRMSKRESALKEWLADHRSEIDPQAHLDENSIERTYWMYGQLIAIRDAMNLIQKELGASRKPYSEDSAN